MPVFDVLRAIVRWLFDSVIGLFPESLTRSLTVLEIVYYIVAIVYFLLEIILLCTK